MIKCITVSSLVTLLAGTAWGLVPYAAFTVPFAIIVTPILIVQLVAWLFRR